MKAKELIVIVQVIVGGVVGTLLGVVVLEWIQPGAAQHLLEVMR